MRILKWLGAPTMVLLLSLVLLYDRIKTEVCFQAVPSVSAVELGRSYGPTLVASYADAWLAAANALEEGKTVEEAQAVLQSTWKQSRIKAFREGVQPRMSLILAEGAEPATSQQRAEVVKFWRDFSVGLKGGSGQ